MKASPHNRICHRICLSRNVTPPPAAPVIKLHRVLLQHHALVLPRRRRLPFGVRRVLSALVRGDKSSREVPTVDAARFAEEEGLLFVEASAKSGDGVEDTFARAACEILDKVRKGVFDCDMLPDVHILDSRSITVVDSSSSAPPLPRLFAFPPCPSLATPTADDDDDDTFPPWNAYTRAVALIPADNLDASPPPPTPARAPPSSARTFPPPPQNSLHPNPRRWYPLHPPRPDAVPARVPPSYAQLLRTHNPTRFPADFFLRRTCLELQPTDYTYAPPRSHPSTFGDETSAPGSVFADGGCADRSPDGACIATGYVLSTKYTSSSSRCAALSTSTTHLIYDGTFPRAFDILRSNRYALLAASLRVSHFRRTGPSLLSSSRILGRPCTGEAGFAAAHRLSAPVRVSTATVSSTLPTSSFLILLSEVLLSSETLYARRALVRRSAIGRTRGILLGMSLHGARRAHDVLMAWAQDIVYGLETRREYSPTPNVCLRGCRTGWIDIRDVRGYKISGGPRSQIHGWERTAHIASTGQLCDVVNGNPGARRGRDKPSQIVAVSAAMRRASPLFIGANCGAAYSDTLFKTPVGEQNHGAYSAPG
ncbi:hypothetical protein C8J57DRAFT_1240843 [Mycena rebaudengoi]|nr:hypothetical protein C8J57DRAFT_1240843 [Mycena rebaudengoi]